MGAFLPLRFLDEEGAMVNSLKNERLWDEEEEK